MPSTVRLLYAASRDSVSVEPFDGVNGGPAGDGDDLNGAGACGHLGGPMMDMFTSASRALLVSVVGIVVIVLMR